MGFVKWLQLDASHQDRILCFVSVLALVKFHKFKLNPWDDPKLVIGDQMLGTPGTFQCEDQSSAFCFLGDGITCLILSSQVKLLYVLMLVKQHSLPS